MVLDATSDQTLDSPAGATAEHRALPLVRPLLAALRLFNRILRSLSARTHWLQGAVEGHFDRRRMWIDHYVDLYSKWPSEGDAMFLERGIFSRTLLGPDSDVLEIACGDGFYTRHFYGPVSRSVLAIDADPAALAFARIANSRHNVRYSIHDIRNGLPEGSFTNVIWDGAMTFLTEQQLDVAVSAIRRGIGPTGTFSGYTHFEPIDQPFVRHRFMSTEDVSALLKRHFQHALVTRTEHPTRINYYFVASDTPTKLIAPVFGSPEVVATDP